MIGSPTPASLATSGAYMPAALTTTSHSIRPWSVSTATTRLSRVSIPVTVVRGSICAPSVRAAAASENVSWLGSR